MKIVFDTKEMRPGCVLIQAALGGSEGIANLFDSKEWLVQITPNMKLYDINESQLQYLVNKINNRRKES